MKLPRNEFSIENNADKRAFKMDQVRFAECCDRIVGMVREHLGIGTYQEKTVHAVVKNYMEPDLSKQEQKVGAFVADICNEQGIIEVQTANFNTLGKKLTEFLKVYPVTIVYPVPFRKWICWIDPKTGERSQKRKSSKKGSPQMIFRELYKIRPFLQHPKLRISILLIHMEEYKLLDGWGKDKKNHASKYDRIPFFLEDEIEINDVPSYKKLIPDGLPEQYTTADFAKKSSITRSDAQKALLLLTELGITQRIGKQKNAYLYRTLLI